MSVLPDHQIRRYNRERPDFGIEPFDEDNLQPASYDLTLGDEWIVPVQGPPETYVDVEDGLPSSWKRAYSAEEFVVSSAQQPDSGPVDSGPFVLAHTQETLSLPDDVTAEVKGRSSMGRLGLIVHTAGWVDPGFSGQVTLELVNVSPNPIRLSAGMRIGQVVFNRTTGSVAEPYGEQSDSKYQGQSGATESRIEEDKN